ncbi:hypothetical protein EKD04_016150 [Chloroflexales bacterium ZM16-3]|nr:hypothetical protein [Chloroflexales bacterium ZM16-3]
MYQTESIHKYPRLLTAIIEWLCVLLVVITSARIGFIFLRALWDIYGRNDLRIGQIPLVLGIVSWIDSGRVGHATNLGDLWPALFMPLGWSALALLATVVLRNAFPAVRTSAQGLLVEFSGTWLPIPWERLLSAKVTADLSGEHFVLLVQTERGWLTPWHRIYSMFYGMAWRPGFYITSNISEFDQLVQTILSESERTARASETARPVRLEEDKPSLLFRLMLSPGAFFSRSATTASGASSAHPSSPSGGPVEAIYPSRITTLIGGTVAILATLTGLRYLSFWSIFLALELPALRGLPPFIWNVSDPRYSELYNAYRTRAVPFLGIDGRPDLPAPWWILVSAHLMLLLAIIAIFWLRSILPSIESRSEGIAVRDSLRGGWRLLPWDRVRALKLTEISDQSQILLLQSPGLPASQRITSLLYDGSPQPGVLITSAINNFQPMLQDALGRITVIEAGGGPPVLRQEARSPLLWMAFGGKAAREMLVADARADASTRVLRPAGLLTAARAMAAIALPPALILALGGILSDRAPSLGLIGVALALWIFGMLEWPLVGLISVLLDDNTGGGEEGYRAFYLYPASQFPRLLPLVAAIILQVVGVPVLPVLAWLGAMAWAFWLGRSLWETLYEWRGSQAILGGLLPVFWQLLLLIGYLVTTR